jgi:aspartate aminotransferase-like enzyme
MSIVSLVLKHHVAKLNKRKILFTPGPASLTYENLVNLGPAFGRGDKAYNTMESEVLGWLKDISGQPNVVRLQGSATLAIEVGLENFVSGKVLLLQTGFYSDRMLAMLSLREDVSVTTASFDEAKNLIGTFDWVIACPTETSNAFFMPLHWLGALASELQAKLFLDATASIGLEQSHDVADVLCFSSCKGLFGLTGAAFIAFKHSPTITPSKFSLDLKTYSERKTTGPYHAIQSLHLVSNNYEKLRRAVEVNKEMMIMRSGTKLLHSIENQPLLCTAISAKVRSRNENVVLYTSRMPGSFSVINHLGEVHLGEKAKGKILNELEFY